MRAHAVLELLAVDDFDAALTAGLLDAPACVTCEPRCNALLAAARDAQLTALAARDRHRARDARLRRRKAEREAARVPKALPTQTPALPAAAADVLARALAKARTPR
ncbi:hypothetical protein [Thermomonas sp.]|uniref:hypothetical protein n=1 Tax=Thermomonas sp. TaxID=1971895 RepID=UPI002487FBC5|nr:hypothetical protein [Thermomonas sp.]MDI1252853.1 hypothetical protein [Thermomonas sp.]